jgi:phosphate starvation-inducible PhoH-like protein
MYKTFKLNSSLKANTVARNKSESTTKKSTPKDAAISNKVNNYKVKAKTENQQLLIDSIRENKITLCNGYPGTGKTVISTCIGMEMLLAGKVDKLIISRPLVETGNSLGHLPGPQPLDAKILTPTGWVLMGDLQVGDKVIGRDGKPANVVGIYPQGVKDVYDICTSNGGKTQTCGDHIWATKNNNDLKHKYDFKLRTTLEIKNSLLNPNVGPKLNHTLPDNEIVQFEQQDLPITPYVLGVLLGDGNFGDSISFASIDNDIINRVASEVKQYDLRLHRVNNSVSYTISGNYANNKTARKIRVTNTINNDVEIYHSLGMAATKTKIKKSSLQGRCSRSATINNTKYEYLDKTERWTNYIKNQVYNLGLEDTLATTKFIPKQYLYNSVENRVALLQGLMDTDGTIKKTTGEQSFTTASKQLALDVVELCRSLGSNATVYTRNRIGKSSTYNNRSITTRYISYEVCIPKFENINPFHLGRKAEQVQVKHPKSRYNKIKSVEYAGQKECQCIKLDNSDHLYITDDYIVTHNTLEEKMYPFLINIYEEMGKYVSPTDIKKLMETKQIEVVPFSFMRGRNFLNAYVHVSEAQNISSKELKLLLTRFGQGSTMVIEGDMQQSDLNYNKESGFTRYFDALSKVEGVGIVELGLEDIVREGIIIDILRAMDTVDKASPLKG